MSDFGHDWTDEQIEALSAKLHDVYAQAANEMQDRLEAWLKDYEKQRKAWEKAVKVGVKTKEEYKNWLKDRAMERSWQTNMINQLAEDAVNADIRARQMINDELPTICAENANMEAYRICKATGLDLSFTIYDQDSIRFLMMDPQIYPTVDAIKDMTWNRQKFASAITQSILQGESIPNAAKRLSGVFDMDEKASVRAARTSITYVEGIGKQRSFKRAEEMGIPIMQEWNALHDGRTRYAHRQMDGVKVRNGEKFNVDGYMMTGPGDPTAPGYLIYNCFVGETNVCSDSKIVRSYKHLFTGKFVTVNTSRGVKFTCTPNHPILTTNGWVSAELLNEGDNLFVASVLDSHVPSGNPNVNHVMTSMQTIHELLGMSSIKRAAGLGVNFHGDVPTSDVEIVTKEGLLRVSWDTRSFEGFDKLLFENPDTPASCGSTLMERFSGVMASPSGVLGCECVSLALLGRHSGHSDSVGLGGTSGFDSTLAQDAIHNVSSMPDISSELLDGISGKVTLDQIVSVEITCGTRHVYNLQTENGYYFVGNSSNGNVIVARNCRCGLTGAIGYKDIAPAVIINNDKFPKDVTYDQWKSGMYRTDASGKETKSSKRERGVS